VVPFFSRRGLRERSSSEVARPKWFSSPVLAKMSKAHSPSTWRRKGGTGTQNNLAELNESEAKL